MSANQNEPLNTEKVMKQMHEQNIINLDASIRDLMKPEGIGIVDPSSPISDNVIAWADYILITSGKLNNVEEIRNVAESLKDVTTKLNQIQ